MQQKHIDDVIAFIEESKLDGVDKDRIWMDLGLFFRSLSRVNDDPSLRTLSAEDRVLIQEQIDKVYDGS